MKTVAIVNPHAGGGAAGRRWRELGRAFECRFTQARGHATTLARELSAAGCHLILAAGGDGTLNEVVNGVLDAGPSSTAIAVLPLASGGDFARTLGIRDLPHALAIVAAAASTQADARPIDAMLARSTAGPRWFVNTASIGLGAQVARSVSQGRTLIGGRAGYLLSAVAHLAQGAAFDVRFSTGDAPPLDLRLTTAALANGRYQGGGMLLAPTAELDDGLLDVTVIEAVGLATLARHVPILYSGAIHTHPKVRHWQARTLRAEAPTAPVPFEVDGEPHGALPIHIEVHPRVWKVLCPR